MKEFVWLYIMCLFAIFAALGILALAFAVLAVLPWLIYVSHGPWMAVPAAIMLMALVLAIVVVAIDV